MIDESDKEVRLPATRFRQTRPHFAAAMPCLFHLERDDDVATHSQSVVVGRGNVKAVGVAVPA